MSSGVFAMAEEIANLAFMEDLTIDQAAEIIGKKYAVFINDVEKMKAEMLLSLLVNPPKTFG